MPLIENVSLLVLPQFAGSKTSLGQEFQSELDRCSVRVMGKVMGQGDDVNHEG
jgi:hypothetical protein